MLIVAIAWGKDFEKSCLSADSHLTAVVRKVFRSSGWISSFGESSASLHLKRVISWAPTNTEKKVSNLGNDIMSFSFFTFRVVENFFRKIYLKPHIKSSSTLGLKYVCAQYEQSKKKYSEVFLLPILVYACGMWIIFCTEQNSRISSLNPGNFENFSISAQQTQIWFNYLVILALFLPSFVFLNCSASKGSNLRFNRERRKSYKMWLSLRSVGRELLKWPWKLSISIRKSQKFIFVFWLRSILKLFSRQRNQITYTKNGR